MNDDDQNMNNNGQSEDSTASLQNDTPIQDDNNGNVEDSNELSDSSAAPQSDNDTPTEAIEEPTEAEQGDEEQPAPEDESQDETTPEEPDNTSEDTENPVTGDSESIGTEASGEDDEAVVEPGSEEDNQDKAVNEAPTDDVIHSDDPNVKWFVVHTYSGHENKVATALKQRVESEHLEHKILDVLVPTQEKIEIRSGKKATVKEKIFPGYILVKMILDDNSWLAVRTTQGVTSFVGIGNKPTPIPEQEVRTIVKYMSEGAAPTFKEVFLVDDTVKIIDGPFSEFIGKVDSVDKEKGKVRVLVSIFGRETPVELDFLQVQKL